MYNAQKLDWKFFSVLLSKPWMHTFYLKHNSDMAHFEAFELVKEVLANIEKLLQEWCHLMSTTSEKISLEMQSAET